MLPLPFLLFHAFCHKPLALTSALSALFGSPEVLDALCSLLGLVRDESWQLGGRDFLLFLPFLGRECGFDRIVKLFRGSKRRC